MSYEGKLLPGITLTTPITSPTYPGCTFTRIDLRYPQTDTVAGVMFVFVDMIGTDQQGQPVRWPDAVFEEVDVEQWEGNFHTNVAEAVKRVWGLDGVVERG